MWIINYSDYRFYSGTNVHKQDLDDSNVLQREFMSKECSFNYQNIFNETAIHFNYA